MHFVAPVGPQRPIPGQAFCHDLDRALDGRAPFTGHRRHTVGPQNGDRMPAFGDDDFFAALHPSEQLGEPLIGVTRADRLHGPWYICECPVLYTGSGIYGVKPAKELTTCHCQRNRRPIAAERALIRKEAVAALVLAMTLSRGSRRWPGTCAVRSSWRPKTSTCCAAPPMPSGCGPRSARPIQAS